MKTLIFAMATLFSVSVFAGPIEDAVRKVEEKDGVQCYKTGESRMMTCLMYACRYTVSYECMGESEFKMKLVVKRNMSGFGSDLPRVSKIKKYF
jgi:hypothetical protein